MFIQIFLRFFLFCQNIFFYFYNKFFIFDNLIIFDNNNKCYYHYKILFNLFYHFNFLFDFNKCNNNNWTCFILKDEKLFIYNINEPTINIFNQLLKAYFIDSNYNNNYITNIILFKINDIVINIAKYNKLTNINNIVIFEKFINNINCNDNDIIIKYMTLNNMILKEFNFIDIKNKIICQI